MNHARLSARVVAPLAVAILAMVIGASMAQGASFGSVDITNVSTSHTVFTGQPAANLISDPGTASPPFLLQLDEDVDALLGFPESGQVTVFALNLKTGARSGLEILTFDNGTCGEAANELCITARAKKTTSNVAHPVGSTAKMATQLTAGISDSQTGAITVTLGLFDPATIYPVDNRTILIDNELIQGDWTNATTFNINPNPGSASPNGRGAETNAGNPTTASAHAAAAIVTVPDSFIFTLTRLLHDTGTDAAASTSKPYTFLQPLFPIIPQPFVGLDLILPPIRLTFTPGAPVNTPGSFNTANGVLTIPFGTCGWPGGETDPPTTLLGAATLQWDKNPLNNQIGGLGTVQDTDHSAYSTLTAAVTAGQAAPFDLVVVDVDATGLVFAGSGQVLVGGALPENSELMTYDAVNTGANTIHVISRGNVGGSVAVAHAIGVPVIQTPVCDEAAEGARTDADTLELGANAAFDSDGDSCSNWNELNQAANSQGTGGLRDPWNSYDYFNPTGDGLNRVDDILAVVSQYFDDDDGATPGLPPYADGYLPGTDRTALTGGAAWQLGPPNGQQRVDDILAAVKQYFHDC